jgi:hypothetical protein
MFSIFNFLFPHGLVTPFGVVAASGGSAGALAGGGTITSSLPDVAPTQAITGDAAALSVSATRFNVGFSTSAKAGSFDIYGHSSLTTICNGRQSGQIVGGLTMQVSIAPADASAPLLFLSGWAAIMPTAPSGKSYPSTVAAISCLPGAVAVTVSPLVTTMVPLMFPPGIRSDVIIPQVIGSNPVLVYAFDSANVRTTTVILTGTINLSGIGYWSGFF